MDGTRTVRGVRCPARGGPQEGPAVLSRLPDRQREALVLRYYQRLTEAEIAESMGISRGTVKSTLARGLHALGGKLSKEEC